MKRCAAIVMVYLFAASLGSRVALAEPGQEKGAMNNQRLGEIIHRLDDKAEGKAGFWRFTIEGKPEMFCGVLSSTRWVCSATAHFYPASGKP